MRNASYVLAATVVATTIAGCGGSSVSSVHASTSTGSGSTTTGSTTAGGLTNLGNLGYIETSYLTGAARDFGDVVANITLGDFTDNYGNTVSTSSGTSLGLQVDAYGGPQVVRTPVTFGTSTTPGVPNTNPNSRLFSNFVFSFNTLTTSVLPGQAIQPSSTFVILNGNMATDEVSTTALSTTTFTPQSYTANIRAFPGRFTSLTVRLDPNTIGLNFQVDGDMDGNTWGPGNPRGIFESTQFNQINFVDPTVPVFNSVISDYLSFDISNMPTASKPSLTQGAVSVVGQRVFFSGDTYGIADNTSSGNFFQLTKDVSGSSAALSGTFNTNTSLNGYTLPGGETAYLPGTYALNEIDPSDPSFLRKILSLEGMFVDYTKMFKSVTTTMAISFPSSSDNNVQDLVLLKANTSGQIVDFYYGYVDFQSLDVYLYPINTVVAAVSNTSYHGKISTSTLYNAAGGTTTDQTAVRSGVFTLDSPLTFLDHTTFQRGTFSVYRR